MSRRKSDTADDEIHAPAPPGDQPPPDSSAEPRWARADWCSGTVCWPPAAAGRRARPRAAEIGGRAGGGGGKTLRISNWPLYIDKQTVPDFEKATGIKTEYTEDINDNAEFFAKIDEPLKRNQSIDREIIVLTDWMAGRLIQPRLRRPARRHQVPQQGQPGRQRAGRELRSGPQVQRAMALRHDRHRATTPRRPAASSPASTTSSTPSSRVRSRC